MAVLTNTMMQGTTADQEGPEPFYIKKSLRFSNTDPTAFTNYFNNEGNRRTWTWAAWVKRGDIADHQALFSCWANTTNNAGYIECDFQPANQIQIGGWSTIYARTSAVFRDTAAWMHVMVAFDSTHEKDTERLRIYVNGERITEFDVTNYPAQDTEWPLNRIGKKHGLANNAYYASNATSQKVDGYLADVYFIDGAALKPQIFGRRDSTGTWNPIALQNWSGNDGRKHSHETQGTLGYGSWADMFTDNNNIVHSPYPGTLYWRPKGGMSGNLRVQIATGLHGQAVNGQFDFKINGTSVFNNSTFPRNTTAWVNFGYRDVVELSWGNNTGDDWTAIKRIEVDGVILVDEDDDTDDLTDFPATGPNDGRTWSSGGSGGTNAGSGFDKMFDGSSSTAMSSSGSASSEVTVTFNPALTVQSVEVNPGSLASQFKINSGSYTTITDDGTYHNLGFSGTLTTLTIKGDSGTNAAPRCEGVRVDGYVLVDDISDNSYHFKFDTSNLTKNTRPGPITGFTKQLPIYNTDSTGQTKESGYRADSSAGSTDGTGLVLAIPGDALTDTDEHDHINGGSSAKTLNNTNCTITTSTSRFYGSSIDFNGTNAKLTTTTDASDFDLSGGTFTFECWFRAGAATSTSKTIVCTKETGDNSELALGINQNYLFSYTGSTQIMTTSNSDAVQMKEGYWYHIAVTRDGTTFRWFIDGTLLHSNATGVSGSSDGCYFGYGSAAGGSPSTRYIEAGYQDIRFYKGVCKYNAAFTVPSSPQWLAENLSATDDTYLDTPLDYGTRSNYCTMSPVSSILTDSSTITEGNLKVTGTNSNSNNAYFFGTMAVKSSDSTGFYYEVTQNVYQSNSAVGFLDANANIASINTQYGLGATEAANSDKGITIFNENNYVNYYGTATANATTDWTSNGDVVGVAVKNNKIWIHINGTYHNSGNPVTEANPTITLSGEKTIIPMIMAIGNGTRPVLTFNGGQRAFSHAPSGFKSYCTKNLDDIFSGDQTNRPISYFDCVTYDGTGVNNNNVNGLKFIPEAVWIKDRGDSNHHRAYDKIRGIDSAWAISNTDAPQQHPAYGQFESFDSDGFTVSKGTSNAEGTNDTTEHVAWCWDAGTAAATPKSGGTSQTVTASDSWVNAAAGFEILKYDSNGSAGNVGHNLNAPPKFIIIKALGAGNINGPAYHAHMDGTSSQYMVINDDFYIATDASSIWNGINPTNEVFGIGSHNMTGGSSFEPYIAWLWAEVEGYSKFDTYDGNNSTDGPFIYTGFRPSLVIIKAHNTGTGWVMYDKARSKHNPNSKVLLADTNGGGSANDAWSGSYPIDMLSNGFKLRGNTGEMNSDNNFLYCAWAEHPFKTARAK